ncbi:DNA polymerase III subunit delta' [Periweissella fabalis]|uniref:DNA polymerase III subunit delta n=1 Tax=Periweissella fabalis TaxID=1070421 RepID=A0A7X6S392_9LACO|nr:DNA polymerase III subunit delta' [Periweissella fabalis]NKZ24363.1 DNA polymerase III subunit delta' [Periweissella fabalis]
MNQIANKEQSMPNDQIIMAYFNKTITKQKLAHAYLFNGPKGAGQEVMAQWLAMRLFCQELRADQPCGQCRNCRRIKAGEHPDVINIKSEKATIKVDEIRLLKQEFTKSAVEGTHKILIIYRADTMTVSAQNSLLKFIEEPVGDTVIILLTENRSLLLPTIISRTQIVEFELPGFKKIEEQLKNNYQLAEVRLALRLTGDADIAQEWLTNGSITKLNNLIWRWFNVLLQGDSAAFAMVQTGFIPLLQDPELPFTANNILDSMMFIFRDLLIIEDSRQLVFEDNRQKLGILGQKIALTKRIVFVDIVLQARQDAQMNINIQTTLEALTLKILANL